MFALIIWQSSGYKDTQLQLQMILAIVISFILFRMTCRWPNNRPKYAAKYLCNTI